MITVLDGIKRREFLAAAGLGGLGMIAPASVRMSYAQRPKTLRAAITSFTLLNTMDPAVVVSIAENMALWGVFNTLVKFEVGMKIVPDLAESWTTPDPSTWIFRLRRGVKFHDGSEMTADDVKFTLDRVKDEKLKSPYRQYFSRVSAIEVVDPYTVKLVTNGPYAALLSYLTNARTGSQIVPRKVVEAVGDAEFGKKPIGTGPFRFVSLQPGQKVVLDAHKDYFVPGQPMVDRVEISLIEQETSVVNALLAGNIDISSSAPFADVAALSKNPAVVVSREPGLNLRYVELNNKIAPFDDVHFRRAVSMAFDREALIQIVLFGEGQPANGPIPSALEWAYKKERYPENTFDPKGAQAELAKSKYKAGTPAVILTFGSSWWKRWAEVFVEQVNDTLGTRFTVEVTDSNALTSRIVANNLQAAVWGFLGLIEADEYTYNFLHTNGARNYRGYSNPTLDGVLEQARGELDSAKRGALYRQAQDIIAQDCPVLSSFYANQDNLWSPRVKGFQPLPYSAFAGQFGAVSLSP